MGHPESIARKLIQEDQRSKWFAHNNHNVRCFTEDEVKIITNNYKTVVGSGGFGEVYQGVLEDKSMVAVKKFIHNVEENFAKELIVHSGINHKNVVRLIGYCVDKNALRIVTEYVPKGNLSNALHKDNLPIPLDTRLSIAIECAEALCYMHSQMYTRVIHGDIKPANILLDERLGAKISDFGISRLVNTESTLYTGTVVGSIGYMDPSFVETGRLEAKSDVYSFGIVLLELITRKKAIPDDGEKRLVETFNQTIAKGIRTVREMFDSEIATPSDLKTVDEIAKLAGKCLRKELRQRPEMLEVAECLRKLRKDHQGEERAGLFSWIRKKQPTPGRTNAIHSRVFSRPPQASSSGSNSTKMTINSTTSSSTTDLFERIPQTSSSGNSSNAISIGSSTTTRKLVFFSSAESALSFDLEDLLRASAEVLGKGSIGTTYKAVLHDGLGSGYAVAVKRLAKMDLPVPEFEQRIREIAAIQGEHIATLRGYYYGNDEKLLVYDYFQAGRLSEILHGHRHPLDWAERSAILLDVARGVASIHSVGTSSSHGNIKSSNVLLTGSHEACVSEHGLTALCPFEKASGYRAPEVINNMYVSQKADAYSFGILLLELFTRKDPAYYGESVDLDLLQFVKSVPRAKWAAEVFDMELRGQQYKSSETEGMVQLLDLAIECCCRHADFRPTMSHVVQQIEKVRQESLRDPAPAPNSDFPARSAFQSASGPVSDLSSASEGSTAAQQFAAPFTFSAEPEPTDGLASDNGVNEDESRIRAKRAEDSAKRCARLRRRNPIANSSSTSGPFVDLSESTNSIAAQHSAAPFTFSAKPLPTDALASDNGVHNNKAGNRPKGAKHSSKRSDRPCRSSPFAISISASSPFVDLSMSTNSIAAQQSAAPFTFSAEPPTDGLVSDNGVHNNKAGNRPKGAKHSSKRSDRPRRSNPFAISSSAGSVDMIAMEGRLGRLDVSSNRQPSDALQDAGLLD